MIIDAFVEQGYAGDDDKVTIKVNPAILNGSKIGTIITVKFICDEFDKNKLKDIL